MFGKVDFRAGYVLHVCIILAH